MSAPHHIYLNFVAEIGCNCTAEAVNKLGSSFQFQSKLKKSKAYKAYVNKEKVVPNVQLKNSNRKPIPFALEYELSEDGALFSTLSNKILRKRKTFGSSQGKVYYSYDLSKYGNVLVSRLVMFVYGKHNYKCIKAMPKVVHIDNDPENHHITNLSFATQSEINIKHNIKPQGPFKKSNIPDDKLEFIKQKLNEQNTYKEIGKLLNVSEMSVFRFVKKYIKN